MVVWSSRVHPFDDYVRVYSRLRGQASPFASRTIQQLLYIRPRHSWLDFLECSLVDSGRCPSEENNDGRRHEDCRQEEPQEPAQFHDKALPHRDSWWVRIRI